MTQNVQGATVLAYLFRKLTVFAASVLIFIHPGGRLAYGAGQFNIYTCYSGPTVVPQTVRSPAETSTQFIPSAMG